MTQALVLNATYEPLCVVPSRRALMLILDEKAELVHSTERMFRAERVALAEPSVVRLSYYVKVPYQARVSLNRRAVFARDGHRCQYCGASAENIDHVIPRSKGGQHAWENCVASCTRCNHRKADRLIEDLGWTLPRDPAAPRGPHWRLIGAINDGDPHWVAYLTEPSAA